MKLNDKNFKFHIIFALIYIFPLILANNYYMDDTNRIIDGSGWNEVGRNLATKIMQLLSFGNQSVDLFPYTTILASLILALAGFYISEILQIEKNQQIKFSGLLLLTSPFMLENLSYRWDSLPMSISIISVIIPFIFISNSKKFIFSSILGILTCILIYQASLVIYGLLIICLIISYCINKTIKEIIYILKTSFISLIIAMLIYKIIVLLFNINFSNRELTIFQSTTPLIFLKNNIENSYFLVKDAFNKPLKILFLMIFLVFIISLIKFIFVPKNKSYKVASLLLLLIIPFVIIFILIIQQNTWFVPRVLIGFPFLIYSLFLFINFFSEKVCSYLSIGALLISLPLMATYSNSLKNQDNFNNFLMQSISSKVDIINNKKIIIEGIEPWCPEVKIPIHNFPILTRLIPRYTHSNFWSSRLIARKTYSEEFSPLINDYEYQEIIKIKKTIPITTKTNFYYIREDQSNIIVDFNKEED